MTSDDDTNDLEEATISWDATRVNFTQTPTWILNNTEINDGAFRTWMAIASFRANRGNTAFPSARRLQKLRGKGRRVIFQHIRQLEDAGLLRREARYRKNGGRSSSHYTLAWSRPLTPVQKAALAPGAESCTPPDAQNRTTPRAKDRAPRTTTTKELDPQPPQQSLSTHLSLSTETQGADAPRTPRSSRSRNRRDGTNPRSVEAAVTKDRQMQQWARNMYPALGHQDFVEMVEYEVETHKITADQGTVAIAESERLDAIAESASMTRSANEP